MSGHSHYATTHRQKELKDAVKGKVFSKLARAITIEKARAASMPKENIDRAISKAAAAGEALDEVMYEGFGPSGVLILVEAATDNRNRTNSEIKNLFEKNGGKMGSPGSVSFNFEPKGLLLVEKSCNIDEELLKLIDLGAEDVVEKDDVIEVFVPFQSLFETQKKMMEAGFKVTEGELIQRPKNLQDVSGEEIQKVESFLENFDNHEDIQKVFTNANI